MARMASSKATSRESQIVNWGDGRRHKHGLLPLPKRGEGAHRASAACSDQSRASGSKIAEPLQILLLLLRARRQLEQTGRVAAENVVLGLLRQERQVPDPARQVEVPVRIVGRVEQLRLRVDQLER